FVNVNLRSYYAEGSKTLAFETVEQLGWETPDAVICPIASGALFSKLWQGFRQFERLGFVGGPLPRLYGGQAEGCSPVAAAFAEDRRVTPVRPNSIAKSLAIGNPADGDLAVATAKASGGAIYTVPEDEVGPNMALLAAINKRIELVRALHDHKRAEGIPLIDPAREQQLVVELQAGNAGPLSDQGVAELFRHVLELTRKELHGA